MLITELIILASVIIWILPANPAPPAKEIAQPTKEIVTGPADHDDLYRSVCKDGETIENCHARIRIHATEAEQARARDVTPLQDLKRGKPRPQSNGRLNPPSAKEVEEIFGKLGARPDIVGIDGSPNSAPSNGDAKHRAMIQSLATKEAVGIEAKTTAIGKVLKDIYSEPEKGLIRSSFPSEISVKELSTVIVEIRGAELTQANTALPALQAGDAFAEIVNKLRVSTIMSVSLTAQTPEAFKITSIDNPSVSVDPIAKPVAANGWQQWKWSIIPLKSGSQTLYVTAYITVPVPGQDVPPLQVYQKTQVIVIPVVPLYKRSWWAARDALQVHWLDILKWSWTALFVPLGLWLWRRIKPNRERTHKKRKLFKLNKPIPAEEEHQDVPSDKVS
ncbi:MAG: hypothetical protein ACM3JB_10975 [Acidobacteriaceae bacterium]